MQKSDFTPASHRNDPHTSHAAERSHTESGKRSNHCRRIWHLVRNNPGSTSSEIAFLASSDLDLQECRRRLADLKNRGAVLQGVARIGRTKKREVTWWTPQAFKDEYDDIPF